MRTIIHQRRRSGRDVTEWLSVIDQFDQLVADRAPLEKLVDAAVALTGRRGGVLDALNGRICVCHAGRRGHGSRSRPGTTARSWRRWRPRVFGAGDRDHRCRRHRGRGSERRRCRRALGVAWLDQGPEPWRPLDELVVQRLSSAAAINSVRLRDDRATRSRSDYAALEQLLSTQMTDEAAAEAVPTGGPPAGSEAHGPGRAPASRRERRTRGARADAIQEPGARRA